VEAVASSSPFGIGSKKFGMWLFIVSDALTFSTLLICYTYARISNPNWPAPFAFSPSIIFATVMTLVLLTSSLTMVMAVHDERRTARWILATMLCGATFVGLHLTEWRHLMVAGITPASNPVGRAAVRRGLLRNYRTPHAARNDRRGLPGHHRGRTLLERRRGGGRTVLAFRRSGVDVRVPADLPDERKAMMIRVWLFLLALTGVEVLLAYLHTPPIVMLVALMGLSLLKAAYIIAYFMHMKFERRSLSFSLFRFSSFASLRC
jgi:hypothetical protein